MNAELKGKVGFTCAYTPVPLIHAAGFIPYRILPLGAEPDQAGSILHDNMCPHVKRVLDRALSGTLPDMAGVVVVNSCDSMRRLADAWPSAKPDDRIVLLDLPYEANDRAASFFASEIERLLGLMASWLGALVDPEQILESVGKYNELVRILDQLATRAARGALSGGWKTLQQLYNRSVTTRIEEVTAEARRLQQETELPQGTGVRIPVYLTGNVMPDPEAFTLLEASGAQVVADDLCTASRQLLHYDLDEKSDLVPQIARQVLSRPPCARTLTPGSPGGFAGQIAARARQAHARAVIVHVMKFCDPYLVRMPALAAALRREGLPMLVLEGDCSMRSLGQHRTRIEAFVEMLGGSPS